jgi:hypothetical protein
MMQQVEYLLASLPMQGEGRLRWPETSSSLLSPYDDIRIPGRRIVSAGVGGLFKPFDHHSSPLALAFIIPCPFPVPSVSCAKRHIFNSQFAHVLDYCDVLCLIQIVTITFVLRSSFLFPTTCTGQHHTSSNRQRLSINCRQLLQLRFIYFIHSVDIDVVGIYSPFFPDITKIRWSSHSTNSPHRRDNIRRYGTFFEINQFRPFFFYLAMDGVRPKKSFGMALVQKEGKCAWPQRVSELWRTPQSLWVAKRDSVI